MRGTMDDQDIVCMPWKHLSLAQRTGYVHGPFPWPDLLCG